MSRNEYRQATTDEETAQAHAKCKNHIRSEKDTVAYAGRAEPKALRSASGETRSIESESAIAEESIVHTTEASRRPGAPLAESGECAMAEARLRRASCVLRAPVFLSVHGGIARDISISAPS
jgi:hypothetical protein